jgi:hypothetical protein
MLDERARMVNLVRCEVLYGHDTRGGPAEATHRADQEHDFPDPRISGPAEFGHPPSLRPRLSGPTLPHVQVACHGRHSILSDNREMPRSGLARACLAMVYPSTLTNRYGPRYPRCWMSREQNECHW